MSDPSADSCYSRRNSALTWISGISNACGALDLSITDEDSDFCSDLKNSSGRQWPRTELADCFQQVESRESPGDIAFGSGLKSVPGGELYKNKTIMSWLVKTVQTFTMSSSSPGTTTSLSSSTTPRSTSGGRRTWPTECSAPPCSLALVRRSPDWAEDSSSQSSGSASRPQPGQTTGAPRSVSG